MTEPRPAPSWMADAAFRMMSKFHAETDCGHDGMHWAECEAACQAHGHDSWEDWIKAHNDAILRTLPPL